MEKKLYVKPQVKVTKIETSVILAGSTGDSKPSPQLQNYEGEEWGDN